jgi:hypothetical protein
MRHIHFFTKKRARFNFRYQKNTWINIPIDDIGYFDSRKLLKMGDLEFLSIMEKLENNRYNLSGIEITETTGKYTVA